MNTIEGTILAQIKPEELIELAVTMENIYNPTGQEGEMTAFVYNWMEKNSFEPRRIGLSEERANVLGRYRGAGNGLTFTFNSHMDVTLGKNEVWRLKVPGQKIYYQAWVEGNIIFGNGVVNDKGPMAAWMIAVKALKEAGIRLKGDVLMSAVIGEINYGPGGGVGSGQNSVPVEDLVVAAKIYALTAYYIGQLSRSVTGV